MQLKLNTKMVSSWAKQFMLVVAVAIAVSACSKDDQPPYVPPAPTGAYANGFFILNEGWFQHEAGSVNFYGYGEDSIRAFAFRNENDAALPTNETGTLENGKIIGENLFLITKVGGPIVVADAATLKEKARITLTGSDFRDITQLTESTALVSSGSNIYELDLHSFTLAETPVYTGENITNLYVDNGYLLAAENGGLRIIGLNDFKSVAQFGGVTEGFVSTPDGDVYGAASNVLVRINADHDTTQIPLTADIAQNTFAYTAPSLVSSEKENAVYYIAADAISYSPKDIYKYKKGDASSLDAPFISLPDGEFLYGSGIGYDSKNDQIITTSITGYDESSKNILRFYDAATGTLKSKIEYPHPYFPAKLVFYPKAD